MDQIDEEAAEKLCAVLGRVSFAIGIAVAAGEGYSAYKAHDTVKVVGEGFTGVALVLMLFGPETGGITIIIATGILAIGTVLASHGEIEELVKPKMIGVFEERFKAFTSAEGHRVGKYFASDLREQIEQVEKAIKALEATDWTDQGLPADELAKAGMSISEV